MIKYLKTKNFKKIGNAEFNFTDGLNIICGANAQGKTTILQAIMFALYGVKSVPVKADKIPTWGESSCEAELEIGEFTITRGLKNCKVFKAGEMVASGNSACANYIQEKVTGVDLNGFKILNWSAQNETSALLTIGAAQLQRDVEKYSGVEYIDQIIKLAGTDHRDLKRDVDLAEFEHTESELKRHIRKHTEVRETLKTKETSLLKTESQLSGEKEQLSSQLHEQKKLLRSYTEAKEKVSEHQQELLQLESEIQSFKDRIEEKAEERGKLKPLTDEEYLSLKERVEEKESLNKAVDKLRETVKQLTSSLEDCVEGAATDKELEQAVSETKERYQQAREDYSQARELEKSKRKEAAGLKRTIEEGVCELCGSILADEDQLQAHKADLEKLEAELDKASTAESEKAGILAKAEAEMQASERKYKSVYGNWKARQAEWEEELSEATETLAKKEGGYTAAEDLEALKSEAYTLETVRDQYQAASGAIVALEQTLSKRSEKEQALKGKIEALRATYPDPLPEQSTVDSLQSEFNQVQDDLTHCAKQLGGVQSQLQTELRVVEDANKELDRMNAIQDTVKKAALLEEFIQYLKDSRVHFISSVWANILGNASAFLDQVTAGSITSLVKSDAEGFMFCEDGVFAPVAAASGAQRAFIGVSVRLALAQSLKASCPVVVLDEPSENMREDNALRLSGGLLGHGQVIMVTHREADRMTAANTIEI